MDLYKVKLEKFEGPLDLLLQLIESEELPISEIALASVMEQYVSYLKKIEDKNPEEMADFLLVASKLLLIKSRVLLPEVDLGLAEDGMSLEEQLRLYREYAVASKEIHKIIGRHKFAWAREKSPLQEGIFAPPPSLTMEKIKLAFLDVLQSIEPVIALPKAAIERVISIKDKIEELRSLILTKAQISFSNVLRVAKNKTEVIVSFLALLELIKQRTVSVSQGDLFEDITVTRI